MVTISSSEPEASADRYIRFMGYRRVEEGVVDTALAKRWGAANTAGRRYSLLRSPDPDAVYLRFVESHAPPDYRPLLSEGWSALELLTRDPYELRDVLADSPFLELAGPAPLSEGSTIHAMQYRGPDGEILYLTADLGDSAASTLAQTRHPVGRPFIVVAAGRELDSLSQYYRQHFHLREAFRLSLSIPFLARAQSLPLGYSYPLTLLRLSAFSHAIELDEYPQAQARAALPGELPPAIASVTFCGEMERSSRPAPAFRPSGIAYGGGALQIHRGAAGELIELLACPAVSEGEASRPAPLH